ALRQLRPHHQLTQLGLHPAEFPLLIWQSARAEVGLAAIQEHPPPLLQLMHGDGDLPRHRHDCLPTQQSQHHLALATGAPPLDARTLASTVARLGLFAHPCLPVPSYRLSRETGSGLGPAYDDHGLVFAAPLGTPTDPA